jgi:hypothetical protein
MHLRRLSPPFSFGKKAAARERARVRGRAVRGIAEGV